MLEFLRQRLPEKLISLEIKRLIGEERTNKRKRIAGEVRAPKMSVSQVLVLMNCLSGGCIETENNLMEKWFLSSKTTFRGVQVPKKQHG